MLAKRQITWHDAYVYHSTKW